MLEDVEQWKRVQSEEDQTTQTLNEVFNDEGTASHEVVNFIWNSEEQVLKKVSPRTFAIRKYIKVPLVLVVGLTGTLSGLTMSLVKCATELNLAEGRISGLSTTLGIIAFAAAALEMLTLNMAMTYFN